MITLICEDPLTLDTMTAVLQHAALEHRTLLLEQVVEPLQTPGESCLLLLFIQDLSHTTLTLCATWTEALTCPILVLAAFNNEAEQLACYEAGAADCILRPISLPLLVARVRAWLRFSPTLGMVDIWLRHEPFALNTQTRDLTIGDSSIRLTVNEARLLQLLLKHPKRVIPPDQIYQHLGLSVHDDTTALKNIIYRLRRKLTTPDPDLHVLIWRENGYAFLP